MLLVFAAISFLKRLEIMSCQDMCNYMENTIPVNAWGFTTGHGMYRLVELKWIPVVFDATHSVQLPGGMGKSSGGAAFYRAVGARRGGRRS